MKKNRLLVLSLLACTLLAGCSETTHVQNGSDAIGNVETGSDGSVNTNLNLQKFFEDLKATNGGAVAVENLLETIADIEYSDDVLAGKVDAPFSVKDYHTTKSLQSDIAEKFEDLVEDKTYFDEDGRFDPEALKEYVEDTLDYEVKDGETSPEFITDAELRKELKYNYDEYIKEKVKPAILQNYIYLDYVTASTKYKGQFANQYAVKLEVLKITQDTTKLNGAWNEAMIKDVKKVTSGKQGIQFGTDYSFVTFNSDNELIIFESKADALEYSVYEVSKENVKKYVPSFQVSDGSENITQLDLVKDADAIATLKQGKKIEEKSWVISTSAKANQEYYEHIEDLLIARQLWKIDYEVAIAKNYDFKTPKYEAMTESEKTEAKTFADTYSSKNTKPMSEVAKQQKITTQQTEYYSEPDYYTKSTYTNVLPTTLSSLRGSSAKDIYSHLNLDFGYDKATKDNMFLLPSKDTLTDPVYLDVASNTYYVCEVSDWYGYFLCENLLDSSKPSKQISNYQIEAYQSGVITPWKLNDEKTKYIADKDGSLVYDSHPEAFESVIDLVQISANNILTDAMKKEAVIALFNKYELEINDQDVYDYIKAQYPDHFKDK